MIEDLFVFIRSSSRIRDFVHYLGWTLGSLILRLFWVFPVNRNKLLFSHFNGKGYGDNPKYICEEIHRRKPDADLVWLTVPSDVNLDFFPEYVRTVPKYSLRAIYEFVTSFVWVNDSRMDDHIRKRHEQRYIQTWHGGFALKKVETDFSTSPKWSILCAKNDSKMADIFVSNSKIQSDVYRSAFWYSGHILEVGYPRNDILVSDSVLDSLRGTISSKLCQIFHYPRNKKIILYAPTFRKNYMHSNVGLDIDCFLTHLSDSFGGDWILLLRLHPNLNWMNQDINIYTNISVYDVSSYPDMQELLAVADVLVTDYSSCMFDFGLTKRPCLLYAPDVETYASDDRGFYIQLSELPFPLYKSNEELMGGIESFDDVMYQKNLAEFYEKYGSFEKGDAAKKVVDWILSQMS